MKRGVWVVVFFLAAALASAASTTETVAGFARVASGRDGFEVQGEPWHPFGCNYFDPHVGWAPKLWQQFDAAKVEEHFRVMRDLGVNVVRVFLTAQSFFPTGVELEPEALRKFDTMLDIARRHGIRVHPTGPDHWEGRAAWRDTDFYADPAALEAQARFWRLFAARYKDEPALFAYDLLNEPHIRWSSPQMEPQWRAWLRQRYARIDLLRQAWGERAENVDTFEDAPAPPDAAAPGSRLLLDYQLFRESLADRWTQIQVDAIRSVDPNHPITVGLIQWSAPVLYGNPSVYCAFRPSRIAPMLDFQSVHFYPFFEGSPFASEESFDLNRAYLELLLRYVKAGAPSRPLLVGEFGWHGGTGRLHDGKAAHTPEQQARWCRAAVLQGRGVAAGWLNWAYADTPSSRDMTKFSGLVTETGERKPWGRAFQALARDPAQWADGVQPPAAIVEFDVERAITDSQAAQAMLRGYCEAWKREKGCRLIVR